MTISSIWGRFSRESRAQQCSHTASQQNNILPLTMFVREILRRSRTSCSTLQAALLYCKRCKDALYAGVDQLSHASEAERKLWIAQTESLCQGLTSALVSTSETLPSLPPPCTELLAASHSGSSNSKAPGAMRSASPLLCGRRMFLAAIVVASKFLQDRTYSNRTWSKISGLETREIEQLERVFLHTIQYDLYVSHTQWAEWTTELSAHWNRTKNEDVPLSPHRRSKQEVTSCTPSRLHRATSENVLGQALQFDSELNVRQSAHRERNHFHRHGSSC